MTLTISVYFRADPLRTRNHFSKLIIIHFQEEIMISFSSHLRIIGHDRLEPGLLILTAILVILSLFLPAAMAENTNGTSLNGTSALSAVASDAVVLPASTQQVTNNATSITTAATTTAAPAVKAPKIEFTVTPTEGIAPLSVTVYPIFNPAGGAPQYVVIDFKDGQQLNETLKTSYQHTYQIAGNYTITLTSVNSGGSNVETMQSPVTVRIPVMETSATPTSVPTVVPNTTVTVPVTTVATLVPNTTVVNATIPTSATGSSSNVSINDSPCFYPNMTQADFRAATVEGPAPLRVEFFDNSTCAPPIAWQWDFGSPVNPGIKTMRDPIMTYTEPGTYNVTLLVINSYNNNSTKTLKGFIHVLPPVTPTPVPVVTSTPAPVPVIVPNFTANLTSGSAPLIVQFTDSSTGPGAVTWFWDFGDGTNATVKNPAHRYNNSGNYTVTLKAAPAGGAPVTKVRESYIIVTSGSTPFPIDIVLAIGIVLVILIIVGLFVMKRKNGGSHHVHSEGHHEETIKSDHESGESRGPRRGRDL
jgi:PKD repeat protein